MLIKSNIRTQKVKLWIKQSIEKIKDAIEVLYLLEYEDIIEKDKNKTK